MPLPPSASDWIRFQKLRQISNVNSKDTMNNVVTPAGCSIPCSSRAGVRRDQDSIAGSSKFRKYASSITDSIAWSRGDFVTLRESTNTTTGTQPRQMLRAQLCNNNTPCVVSVLDTKVGILRSNIYQHSRIV